MDDEISHWRKKIDEIDLELLKLLNERSRCAIEIGKIKEQLNLEIYDPKREKDVIRNVTRQSRNGPLKKEAVKRLFERIIDESRRAEREARDSGKRRRSQYRGNRKKRRNSDD